MELSYVADPSHPPSSSLIIHKDHPFNAEPPLPQLVEHYVTPEPTFFKRNHGPIPDIDKTKHRVEVKGLVATNLSLGVEELRSRFEKVDVVATLECAGNRRDHLDKVKKTKGVIWSAGAVGTAWWTGARLRDVLMAAGVPTDPRNRVQATWHVAFEGADECEEEKDKDVGKRGYGSSIPLEKAMDPLGDVLLAYEMNGKPLSRLHGYPIRVVVPGYIGARSVKWLARITIQAEESRAFFQQRDYKILPPFVTSDEEAAEYWDRVPSIGETNVQSVICEPASAEDVRPGMATVRGYAFSGGGRLIQRVDLSIDGGQTWRCADLCQPSTGPRQWSWCLWQARVRLEKDSRLVCRAVDLAGNTQPEEPMWNYRGVMSNARFRIPDNKVPAQSYQKKGKKLTQTQPPVHIQAHLSDKKSGTKANF